jgi:hypothetical protein
VLLTALSTASHFIQLHFDISANALEIRPLLTVRNFNIDFLDGKCFSLYKSNLIKYNLKSKDF